MFSYSARVSRRNPVRPVPASRVCSAFSNDSRNHFTVAAVSLAGGRAFFFGGISPDSMRS